MMKPPCIRQPVSTNQERGASDSETRAKMNFRNRGQSLAPMRERKTPRAASRSAAAVQLIWIRSRVNESPA